MIQNTTMEWSFIKYNNKYYQHLTNPHVLTRDQLIEFILDSMKYEMPKVTEILKRDYSMQYMERQIRENMTQNYMTLNNPSNEVYNPITVNTEKIRHTIAETDTLRSIVIAIMGRKPEQATPIQDVKDSQMESMAKQLQELQERIDQMAQTPKIKPKAKPAPVEEIVPAPVEQPELTPESDPVPVPVPEGELPPLETMEKTKEDF